MKINRVADEMKAPCWAFEDVENVSPSEFINREYITAEEIERIEQLPVSDLTDDDIVEQREQIEKSAESDSLYHFNSEWPENVKSSLKEYAIVCGMDMSKFKSVHPEYIESIKVVKRESDDFYALSSKDKKEFLRTASKDKEATLLEDPFKLDEKADMSHMDKANWEDVKKQDNLGDRPSMEGSVRPVRGGEDYFTNSYAQTAIGHNSITDPNAIETYAESEQEDTGARLKRENEEKASAREANHKEWEQEKIDAMEGSEIIPRGNVFPTEVMNAQPGIRGDDPFGLDSVPEKTQGERIADVNEENRKAIQGEDKEEHEFVMNKARIRSVSDTFGDELKKYIK